MKPESRSQTQVHTFATSSGHVQTFATKVRHVQTFATKVRHVQTFATKVRHVQTFATKVRHVQTFATKVRHVRTFATAMIRRDYRDRNEDGATEKSRTMSGMPRLLRPRFAIPRFSQPSWRRRDENNARWRRCEMHTTRRDGDETISRIRRRRRCFPDQGGGGAIFQASTEQVRPKTNSLRPWWMRHKFRNRSGDYAIFHTKAKTAHLSRPRRRGRDQ